MCGFVGEMRWDGKSPNIARMQKMLEALKSRGPDAGGLYCQGSFAVGHRRLKIIDLSEHSGQPMIDSQLGLGVVYNGAIYNYPQLREELQAKGYSFFSHGDTEVLLKAYHAWGKDFVKRLNGMFAFALWERDSGKLLLGRDRLGIKPLYLAKIPGGIRFGSSLPSLIKGGDVNTELDPQGLHYYFSFHSVVPAPRTILKGVQKLKPATLRVQDPQGGFEEYAYWDLDAARPEDDNAKSFAELKAEVHQALRTAINRRMVADVPVGVLLSGGLDSSLVVGLLAEAGVKDLQTFSIGFESVGGESGHEFEYSDLVAEHFSTRHHKIVVDEKGTLTHLADCIRAMSEPMVSHDNIGFYLLSREVAKHVKVVQSGQGADEIFGGYSWYPPLLQSEDALSDYAREFFDRDHGEMEQLLETSWLEENHSLEFVKDHFEKPGRDLAVDKALRLDTEVMLVEDPVKRVDNMTMAWGLEARVPFLDHELVECAHRVPARWKIREGGKYILKEVAREVIPHQVIDRPKGYFPVPALRYLQGAYLERVRDILFQKAARERKLINENYLENLLSAPDRHLTPLKVSKLWQVALLEFWLQTHLKNHGTG